MDTMEEEKLMKDSESAERELQNIIKKDAKKVYTGFSTISEIRIIE